jgi:hypothetical protein
MHIEQFGKLRQCPITPDGGEAGGPPWQPQKARLESETSSA